MKRTVSLVLVFLVLFSAALFFPRQAGAVSVDDCYRNISRCRQLALGSDAGWFRMTLMLTACDLAFGVCIYSANKQI
jgi:ABC-type glycerol-3-phosphate transport system permease component